jgi:hypothetical protein
MIKSIQYRTASPVVSHQVNLFFALPHNGSVSFASTPFLVLSTQQEVCNDAASEEEQGKICQHNAMSEAVEWLVCCAIDVAGHDSVQVAPSDHETQRDAALVHAFGVVGAP